MNQNQLPPWVWIASGLGVAGLVFLLTCTYVVDEREQAVILQFGAPVASRTEPGLYFKAPFVQEVRRLPKTLRFWESGNDVVKDLPTADGKKIEVSTWAVWRITDPAAFVQNLGTIGQGEAAVVVRVRSAIRDIITAHSLEEVVRSSERELTYSFQDLLSEISDENQMDPDVTVAQPGVSGRVRFGRERILDLVGQKVTAQLKSQSEESNNSARGIELVEVGISNIEFVPQVREAAFERQKAFMESIAAGYSNAGVQRKQEILNRTNAEVERLLGEGEQQSRTIRGQADAENIRRFGEAIQETGEFYEFARKLEIYQEALVGNTRLVLSTDSDLLRMLKGLEPMADLAPPSTSEEVAATSPEVRASAETPESNSSAGEPSADETSVPERKAIEASKTPE